MRARPPGARPCLLIHPPAFFCLCRENPAQISEAPHWALMRRRLLWELVGSRDPPRAAFLFFFFIGHFQTNSRISEWQQWLWWGWGGRGGGRGKIHCSFIFFWLGLQIETWCMPRIASIKFAVRLSLWVTSFFSKQWHARLFPKQMQSAVWNIIKRAPQGRAGTCVQSWRECLPPGHLIQNQNFWVSVTGSLSCWNEQPNMV